MTDRPLHLGDQVLAAARKQVADGAKFKPSADAERRPVTTVKSAALHDLQIRATVEGHSFLADEAFDKGGHDSGPAPMRYFLGGLMMCHQVWCIKLALLRGIELQSLEGEISCFIGSSTESDSFSPGRLLDLISYKVILHSPGSPDDITNLVEEAFRLCPAFGTVGRGARIEVTLQLNDAIVFETVYAPSQFAV